MKTEMTNAEIKFIKTLNSMKMLDGVSSVSLGFSGGADSSALLDMMYGECKKRNILLTAIHVNHMIRGDEAYADEKHCEEFCSARGIPFIAVRRDIPALAKELKLGTEECARNVRYEIFEKICREAHIDLIATAHNADDNLETVLFNLSRGASGRGLCGIPPKRGNIIRPLISCTKDEIIEYCRSKEIDFVTDSSNSDTGYTRNFIRHRIIPLIKEINPMAAENAYNACRSLRDDEDFIGICANSLPLNKETHPAVIKRVFRNKYSLISDESNLSSVHYECVSELVKSGKRNIFLSLPGKIRVAVGYDGDFIFESDTRTDKIRTEGIFPLKKGVNLIPELDCRIDILPHNAVCDKCTENIYKLTMKAEVSFDTISDNESVFCRARKPGDSYRFGNMTRSVKKLLWGMKNITLSEKMNYPVICDGNGILFLPGFRVRDGAYDRESSGYTVKVYMFEKNALKE